MSLPCRKIIHVATYSAGKPDMGNRQPTTKFVILHELFKVRGKNRNPWKVDDFKSSYPLNIILPLSAIKCPIFLFSSIRH